MQCHVGNGQATLSLCQQSLNLLSTENHLVRAIVNWTQLRASYISSTNNAVFAIQSGLQASSLAQAAEQTPLAIVIMGTTACYMIGAGRLREAQQLTQQAMLLGTQQLGIVLPDVGWPALFQANLLREWNQLDAARALVSEGIEQCKQTESMSLLVHLLYGYSMLLRICLSRGELDTARSALQQFEHIGMSMNQHVYLHVRSHFTAIDQWRTRACHALDQRNGCGRTTWHSLCT